MREVIKDVLSVVPTALTTLVSNLGRYNPLAIRLQIGRSIIAVAGLLTLSLSSWANLTASVLGRSETLHCAGPRQLSLFCLGSDSPSELGRWLGIAVLVLVLSGLLPRVVSVLHLWVAFSMNVSLSLPDGGEAVATFATAFLAGILVADNRICAWLPPRHQPSERLRAISYAVALGLCLEIAGIYFESGLSKIAVSEWADGSAMYYILRDPYFGATGAIGGVLKAVSASPLGTALLSWGTILTEILIALLFLLPWRWKKIGLVLAVGLHLGIAVVMGIWSFSLTMIGLVLIAAYSLRTAEEQTT